MSARLLGILAASVALAGPAGAAVLPFEGTLTFELPALPALAIPGAGLATVEASGGQLVGLRLAGGIAGSAAATVSDPELSFEIPQLRATATLGTGTLSPFWPAAPSSAPQLEQATVPLQGRLRLCLLFSDCASAIDLPLSANDGATAVGVGGVLTIAGLRISLAAAPWTVGRAALQIATASGTTTLYASGRVHGALSLPGSTAQPGGSLSLVTPMQVTSQAGQELAGFARLTLRFAPEPGRALLLASGVAVLALLGRRRARPFR